MKIIAPRIPETLVPADRRQLEEMYAEEADLTRLRLEKTDLQIVDRSNVETYREDEHESR